MRDIVTVETGPDGSVILALDTAGGDYEYEDLSVELDGRTIHIETPDGNQPVGLEVVHGDTA
jgi:hypothetical protein